MVKIVFVVQIISLTIIMPYFLVNLMLIKLGEKFPLQGSQKMGQSAKY